MAHQNFYHQPQLVDRAKLLRETMTEAENYLWQKLRARNLNGYKFRRQQPIGNYIVDFVCTQPKLIIEADGGQHAIQQEYDNERTAYLNSLGFKVIRFWNHEILNHGDDVLEHIVRILEELDRES